MCCSECDLWKLTNAYHNESKLVKLLHISESLLRQMVASGCITADQMHRVLRKPTREEQNRALFDALNQQGSFQQTVECFRHSKQNAALLWVLEHKGGSTFLSLLHYSVMSIPSSGWHKCATAKLKT